MEQHDAKDKAMLHETHKGLKYGRRRKRRTKHHWSNTKRVSGVNKADSYQSKQNKVMGGDRDTRKRSTWLCKQNITWQQREKKPKP